MVVNWDLFAIGCLFVAVRLESGLGLIYWCLLGILF